MLLWRQGEDNISSLKFFEPCLAYFLQARFCGPVLLCMVLIHELGAINDTPGADIILDLNYVLTLML